MKHSTDNVLSIGFVSTYPPTACGLATFTEALRSALQARRDPPVEMGVVSLVGEREPSPRAEVEYQHLCGDSDSLRHAIAALNRHRVVFLQHEYGVYGGPDGVEVLDLLANLRVPVVTTLHTVLARPTTRQRKILERIVELSARSVVMSETARKWLIRGYQVDPAKVTMIPHGATATPAPVVAGAGTGQRSRPLILTWGLISPGKGLETALDAFARLRDLRPMPRYLILGRTHPRVQATQGDAYLDGLRGRVEALGLEDIVEFDGRYLDTNTLVELIRRCDAVLLPYQSTEQVTSGVLVEAVAAGKPVIATGFPHGVELLGNGAGMVVPRSDPDAMADALRRLLTDGEMAADMARTAAKIGAMLRWPVVAVQYAVVATSVLAPAEDVTLLPLVPAPDDLADVG